MPIRIYSIKPPALFHSFASPHCDPTASASAVSNAASRRRRARVVYSAIFAMRSLCGELYDSVLVMLPGPTTRMDVNPVVMVLRGLFGGKVVASVAPDSAMAQVDLVVACIYGARVSTKTCFEDT